VTRSNLVEEKSLKHPRGKRNVQLKKYFQTLHVLRRIRGKPAINYSILPFPLEEPIARWILE
jgi:hypothetical protein